MSDGIVARLARLAEFGRGAHGIDRPQASAQERSARDVFAQWARDGGYTLSQDRVGNLFARREGLRAGLAPIVVGSHLDTVKTGGAYDGAYGVAGAMCALDLLRAREIVTQHPIEAAAWVGEEGGRFPLGCLGSSVFAGIVDADRALSLCDADGVSLGDALAAPQTGLLDLPSRGNTDVAAYLELHVEQGPILEAAQTSLGIVTAIAGQRRLRVTIDGVSGHAGTVPMIARADALCAAAELILACESAAKAAGSAVATVGRIAIEPNEPNVVPGRATFTLDIRSPDDTHLDAIEAALARAARDVERRGVRVAVEAFERRTPTPMTPALREALHRAAKALGHEAIDVPSGAGHDAMSLATVAPTAMLFVPSIGGRSHVGEERTADADLVLGVETLARGIVEVDALLDANPSRV